MQVLAGKLKILVVAGKFRRYGMVSAHTMVFIFQERSTENSIIRLRFYSQRGKNEAKRIKDSGGRGRTEVLVAPRFSASIEL